MADFCNQCAELLFGPDYSDFKGLSSEADTKAGLYPIVLCEECGPIQVDHLGNCISPDCYNKHGALQ